MTILSIRIYPDPVLRVRCPRVETFDDELRELISNMVETMHDAPGIGLAAPQVGVEKRVCVVDLSAGERPEDLLVLVNPRLITEDGSDDDEEGCLSLPGFTEKVKRAFSVRVEAVSGDGDDLRVEAEGLLARAIRHEIDHLDGILFTDRLRGLRRERGRRALKRIAKEQRAERA